jgi:uncharacterized caspase-like protein
MRYLTLVVSLFCLLFSAESALADKRVAFVLGNGAYKNVVQLPNPPVDAKAVASMLRNIGFEVIEGTNLDHKAMTDKLIDFGTKAQNADIAVFYYAGHGIAVSGTNYLLPVDADVKSEMDVKLKYGINIDLTLDQTLSSAKVKLVLLDACRDDPFKDLKEASRSVTQDKGLAEMKSGEGTLIAFATSPGKTALDGPEGTHSPFTSALLAHLTEQGVELQQVMTEVRAEVNDQTHKQQLPWGNTNLTGSVFLNPAAAAPAAAAATPASGTAAPAVASTGTNGADMELEFWRSVKDANKTEEYNAYLTRYPEGQFKSLALARIAELQNGPSTTSRNISGTGNAGVDPATFTEDSSQLTEDQIGLDRNQRKDVQRRLTGLGFDTKVNGKFDDDTRAVIKRWQSARNYPSTGYLNKLQHKALLSEIVASVKPDDDDSSSSERHHASSGGGGGRRVYRNNGGGGGNPGAAMGGFVGGMMGGMFRH